MVVGQLLPYSVQGLAICDLTPVELLQRNSRFGTGLLRPRYILGEGRGGGGEIRFRYGASAREKREGGGVAITYMEQLLGHQGQGEAEERHRDREGVVEGGHQGQEGVEARIHQVVRQARQG